jgi:hypothetical protein
VLFGGQLAHGVVFAALTRKTSRNVAAQLQMILAQHRQAEEAVSAEVAVLTIESCLEVDRHRHRCF